MNISFGKKIPLSQCQIQNKETGNFEKATVYELDCKDKNDILAKYTIEGVNFPLGISNFELNKVLFENYKGTLPTIEEIESELKG